MSDKTPSKTKAGVKVSIPPFAEFELSREWEAGSDKVIYYGDQIGIRVCDGTYWQVNRDEGDKVMALSRHIEKWEIMEIVSVDDEFVAKKNRPVKYNEKVAFRFIENNHFVGVDFNSSNNVLTARVPWVKEWEMFQLLACPRRKRSTDKKLRYGSWFALRAQNGKHVMFDEGDSKQLLAYVSHISDWEAFVFLDPSSAR